MNKSYWIIGVIIVLLAAGAVYYFSTNTSNTDYNSNVTNQQPINNNQDQTSSQNQTSTGGIASTTSGNQTFMVTYTDNGFSPNVLTIKAGDSVTFTNDSSGGMRVASNPHPAHTDYPTRGGCVASTFDECQIGGSGASWTFKFDIAGTWGYHNHANPADKGTIVVQ